MKSLPKMPMPLIEETCNNFCDELWKLADRESRELAEALSEFQDNLRDFMIRELYASSIVEVEKS